MKRPVLKTLTVLSLSILLLAFGTPVHASASTVASKTTNPPPRVRAHVEVTTDPTPPHKGSNTVRVKLAAEDGKPISGAQVTVTLLMPAMPEMGMAAMKTVIEAMSKGGGIYEGKADIGSGGRWQLTVTATQNGRAIAKKQLTLNVTGGM
ncbi:MAG: FixH family protein [Acidobacteriaceae bacterium]